jgi:hypothetical protein
VFDFLSQLLKIVGGVAVIVGASSAAAYGLFRVFATKWIETRFSEHLEAFKHQQNQEIEHLRFRINTMMDRTVKLHQREFDVLPEAWGRLTDTFNIARLVALGFQRYPNVDKMTDDQLEEFLKQSSLAEWQKNELKAAADKTRYYADANASWELHNARKSFIEFHGYLSKNGIFIPDEIKKKFVQLDGLLNAALLERQFSLQYRDLGRAQEFKEGEILHTKGTELLKSLEQDVQRRLWETETRNSQSTTDFP